MGNKNGKPKPIQFTGDNVSEIMDWLKESGTSIVSNKHGKTVLHVNKLVIQENDYLIKSEDGVDVSTVIRPIQESRSIFEFADKYFERISKNKT